MTNASSSNGRHTDTASPTVPATMRHYNTEDEGRFLAQQAADAKTAIKRTVAEMKDTAMEAANVRWWTQQYPWYAVGAAAVLGFVTTARALAPPKPSAPQAAPPVVAQSSWTSSLFEMLRSTLMSAIIGALHSSGEQKGQAQSSTEQPGDQRSPEPVGWR